MVSERFSQYGLELEDNEVRQFERFLELFLEYNAHTNLSAIRDPEGVIEKHFVDSAMLLAQLTPHGRVLDIGTGGGFPGIPLKILLPETEFVLLDSVGKKTKATNHFIQELGLTGITSIQDRAENLAKNPDYREKFDFVVSRATAYLPTILEWAKPFLKPDGTIILYKLPSREERNDGSKACKKFSLRFSEELSYELAGQERVFLLYRNA